MKVEALTSFAGRVSMFKGEVKDIDDSLADSLSKVGYVKKIEEKKETKKNGKTSDTKAVHAS